MGFSFTDWIITVNGYTFSRSNEREAREVFEQFKRSRKVNGFKIRSEIVLMQPTPQGWVKIEVIPKGA